MCGCIQGMDASWDPTALRRARNLNSRQQHVCGRCRGDTVGSIRNDMKMESNGFAKRPTI